MKKYIQKCEIYSMMFNDILFVATLLLKNKLPFDCYIDIGVDRPEYLTFAAHMFKKVIALEPSEKYDYINNYIKKYKDLNITVYNIAASDKNYTGNFYQNTSRSEYSTSDLERVYSLEYKKLFFHEDWKIKKTKYRRIDDMGLINPGRTLSYLKSDIETDEMIAIRGAADVIKKYRPVVQLEHVHENCNMDECRSFFESIDYRFIQPWIETDNIFIIPAEIEYNEPLCN